LVKLLADTLIADAAFRNYVIEKGASYLAEDVIGDPIAYWKDEHDIYEDELSYDVEKIIQMESKKWKAAPVITVAPRDFYQVRLIADRIKETLNPRTGLRDEVKALQRRPKAPSHAGERNQENLLAQ